jgi:uncharacterized iron-regulated membrane protein
MSRNVNWWTRKFHRWGALICAIPMMVVIASGLLLQVKKQVEWIQPATRAGVSTNQIPKQSWSDILQVARGVPSAEVDGWEDIDRLDMRPAKGIVKVRCKNRWEVQIDLYSGEVLSSTFRRSDLIESLHDGSFFTDSVKTWIFLPNGVVLLGLWITGVWLWYLPFHSRRKKNRRATGKI